MSARQVQDGISVLDWSPTVEISAEVRRLAEAGSASRAILVNLSPCPNLRADHIEALTEARTVCHDRSQTIGMFGLNDTLERLVELLGVGEDLPEVLGKTELEALEALNGASAPVPAQVSPPPAPLPVPAAAPAGGSVDFEFDLGGDAAHAPTARFDPSTIVAGDFGAESGAAVPEDQPDTELLVVHWQDLVATGYVIGGEDSDAIMEALATEASAASAAPATAPASAEDDLIDIDLGDVVPATVSSGPPVAGGAAFQNTQRPSARLERVEIDPVPAPAPAPGWSATPAAVDVDFSPPASTESMFGTSGGAGDFSPVAGADLGAPPAGVLEAQAGAPPAGAPPAPVSPLDQGAFGQFGAGDEDDGDGTVMFQPGALDAALLQAGLAAAGPAPVSAPSAAPAEGWQESTSALGASPEPAPAASAFGAGTDQTVMFQPGALDAALLAEVAAAAGAESPAPSPSVEPTPADAGAALVAQHHVPEGQEVDVRLFMHDYAVHSDAHIVILQHLAKSREEALGKHELANSSGVAAELTREVVDQFVQARLLRRSRSPRLRGGVGFVFSPSPKGFNTVQRLLRMWGDPVGRTKLTSWIRELAVSS